MKIQIFKLIAILAIFMGWFSCSNDEDESIGFQWDGSLQQEEYRPINPGEESSSFKIDDNIISFAVPYLVGTLATEHLPEPSYETPEGYSPHFWTILLIMEKGTDCTKLAPVITLASDVTMTWIHPSNEQAPSKEVDYTGIVEIGMDNYKSQVDFTVVTPDGSTVTYVFLAVAVDDVLPCVNCP